MDNKLWSVCQWSLLFRETFCILLQLYLFGLSNLSLCLLQLKCTKHATLPRCFYKNCKSIKIVTVIFYNGFSDDAIMLLIVTKLTFTIIVNIAIINKVTCFQHFNCIYIESTTWKVKLIARSCRELPQICLSDRAKKLNERPRIINVSYRKILSTKHYNLPSA